MLTSDDFSTYVADLLSGTYDCVDRICVRGYFPLGQTSGGLLTWWNQLFPNTELSEQRLRKLAGAFGRRGHAYDRKHQNPRRSFPPHGAERATTAQAGGGLCPARACLCPQTSNPAALFCHRRQDQARPSRKASPRRPSLPRCLCHIRCQSPGPGLASQKQSRRQRGIAPAQELAAGLSLPFSYCGPAVGTPHHQDERPSALWLANFSQWA